MTKQYLVCVQHRYQENENTFYNLRRLVYGFNGGNYYLELERAKADLERYIKDHARGERTETTQCGMIGISSHIDKETAYQHEVTNWYIKVREVTPWEEVEKANKPV